MNTLDKVNAELNSLQEELSQLKHYTTEIGKAKEASNAVLDVSKQFLTTFQQRGEAINAEMETAAADFKKKCQESSQNLEFSGRAFQKGITEAQKTLDYVGNELSIVAEKVNTLAAKIESINILEHFEKIHFGLQATAAEQQRTSKTIKVMFSVMFASIAVAVVLCAVVVIKVH